MPTLARPRLTIAEQRQEIPRAVLALVDANNAIRKELAALLAQIDELGAPSGAATGQLGGTYPGPDVRGVRETGGPTELAMGAVADGAFLKRSGSSVVGDATVVTGSGANDRLALWSGTRTLDSEATLTLDNPGSIGPVLHHSNAHIGAGRNVWAGFGNQATSGADADFNYFGYAAGGYVPYVRLRGHGDFSSSEFGNEWRVDTWIGASHRTALRVDQPFGSLETGLSADVKVSGTHSLARVMMGPTQNVGHSLQFVTIQGVAAAGPVVALGLAVGDIVRTVQGIGPGLGVVGSAAALFEATITVINQIQQTGAGLAADHYLVVVERRSATGATNERALYVVP